MTRPSQRPKAVDFNANKSTAGRRRRNVNGFFPSLKPRSAAKQSSHLTSYSVENATKPPSMDIPLQLIPTSYSQVRPKSASRSISRSSRYSQRSIYKSPELVHNATVSDALRVCPEMFECNQLNSLPQPKRVLPKKVLPWVFRYKVKRNMNELSKIMMNKPIYVDVPL